MTMFLLYFIYYTNNEIYSTSTCISKGELHGTGRDPAGYSGILRGRFYSFLICKTGMLLWREDILTLTIYKTLTYDSFNKENPYPYLVV